MTPDFNYGDGRSYYVSLLLKYLSRSGLKVHLLTNGGNSIERAEDYGIKVFMKNSLKSKANLINSVKFIRELIDKHNIQIIHSHHRYFELLANSAAAVTRKKVRTVSTSLSLVDGRYFVEFKSDRIIAVSNSIKKMLINKFNVDRRKILLIPNFTDSEELKTYKKPVKCKNLFSKDRISLLCVGRLHKDKNQITLLKAVKLLGNDKIIVTLIGEGDEESVLKNFTERNKIKAEFVKESKNLNPYYQKADICILPSLKDPFPGFMLQSGLFGKPFIGSDTDGISELIKHGINGMLFSKGNSAELAEAIRDLIEDDKLRNKCAGNLNETVINNYTEKKIIPEIISLYRNLIR